MSTEPPKSTPGGLLGILQAIFNYIDKPWKALVVFGLIFIGGSGYMVYLMRDRIINVIVRPDTQHLVPLNELWDQVPHLAAGTHADMVVIATVDVISNTQHVMVEWIDGHPADVLMDYLPAVNDTRNEGVIKAMTQGRVACVDITSFSKIVQDIVDHDIKRVCIVPIKADLGYTIGVIYLGWRNLLDERSEGMITMVAKSTAKQMVAK